MKIYFEMGSKFAGFSFFFAYVLVADELKSEYRISSLCRITGSFVGISIW